MKGTLDMTENTETSFWSRCMGISPQDRKNQRRILWATLSWAVVYTGSMWIIKRELIAAPAAWALAAVTAATGVVVLFVYGRFLRQTDELARLVQLEALALGFGGTFFALSAYSVCEQLGSPPLDLEDAPIVMVAFYFLGVFLGWRRYR